MGWLWKLSWILPIRGLRPVTGFVIIASSMLKRWKKFRRFFMPWSIWLPGPDTFTSARKMPKIPSVWHLKPSPKIPPVSLTFLSTLRCAVPGSFPCGILFFRCSKEVWAPSWMPLRPRIGPYILSRPRTKRTSTIWWTYTWTPPFSRNSMVSASSRRDTAWRSTTVIKGRTQNFPG